MDVEFAIPWTEELVLAAQRHLSRHALRRFRLLVLPAALVPGAVCILGLVYQQWVIAFIGLGVALGLAGIAIGRPLQLNSQVKQHVQAHFQKYGPYDLVFRIEDNGVATKTPTSQSHTTWDKFETLWRLPDMWILYITKLSFVILPADKVAGALGEFIIEKVRENGGTVK